MSWRLQDRVRAQPRLPESPPLIQIVMNGWSVEIAISVCVVSRRAINVCEISSCAGGLTSGPLAFKIYLEHHRPVAAAAAFLQRLCAWIRLQQLFLAACAYLFSTLDMSDIALTHVVR